MFYWDMDQTLEAQSLQAIPTLGPKVCNLCLHGPQRSHVAPTLGYLEPDEVKLVISGSDRFRLSCVWVRRFRELAPLLSVDLFTPTRVQVRFKYFGMHTPPKPILQLLVPKSQVLT